MARVTRVDDIAGTVDQVSRPASRHHRPGGRCPHGPALPNAAPPPTAALPAVVMSDPESARHQHAGPHRADRRDARSGGTDAPQGHETQPRRFSARPTSSTSPSTTSSRCCATPPSSSPSSSSCFCSTSAPRSSRSPPLPLSLAVGILVLDGLGLSINVMTLGGLAVAIGELVDDAIIDVENVFRRLNENAAPPAAERKPVAGRDLRRQQRDPSVGGLRHHHHLHGLRAAAVPEGLEGRFFRPLGIAYISLDLRLAAGRPDGHAGDVPCSCMTRQRGAAPQETGHSAGPLAQSDSMSRRCAGRCATASSCSAPRPAAPCWRCCSRPPSARSFLPAFNEGTFTVFLIAPPGTSLEESNRLAIGDREATARASNGVQSVTRRTGRAERDEHAEPVSSSEIEVTLKPGFSKDEVRGQSTRSSPMSPASPPWSASPSSTGSQPHAFGHARGHRHQRLRRRPRHAAHLAKEIEGELKAFPGTRDVAANREVMITSLPVRLPPARPRRLPASRPPPPPSRCAALYGETVAEVNQGAATLRDRRPPRRERTRDASIDHG